MQFGSDNQTGASPQVLEMVCTANAGHTHGYGDDEWCARAKEALEKVFDHSLEVFFVATGSAANCLALSSLVRPWQTILCHHQAHVICDESTAPEFFSGGARPVAITKTADKLTAEHLERYFHSSTPEEPHTPLPGALTITQANELGKIYSISEIHDICAVAHAHGLHVHMDGARFANAVAALHCTPADITWKAGIDVLSLGATKCGGLMAEAVLFFKPELAASLAHTRKRSGHLVSKGRFFGSQFVGWLNNDHWLHLATHANNQANRLATELKKTTSVRLVRPCEGNELFVLMPKALANELHAAGAEFYHWPVQGLPEGSTMAQDEIFARLVTSFATTDEQINEFCSSIRKFEQHRS